MALTTAPKIVCKFISLINYNLGIWNMCLYTLKPLTNLIPSKVKFKWTCVK